MLITGCFLLAAYLSGMLRGRPQSLSTRAGDGVQRPLVPALPAAPEACVPCMRSCSGVKVACPGVRGAEGQGEAPGVTARWGLKAAWKQRAGRGTRTGYTVWYSRGERARNREALHPHAGGALYIRRSARQGLPLPREASACPGKWRATKFGQHVLNEHGRKLSAEIPWHATSRGTGEASRGKRSYRPMHRRRIYKVRPAVDGGLCGRVPARPERTTPSYPVRVPRPARSFHAAFRRPLTRTPLRFPCPSAPRIPGQGTCTPEHDSMHGTHARA